MTALAANLREPGRMDAARKMGRSPPTDAAAQLANIRCPALVFIPCPDDRLHRPRAAGRVS
jgi:hypothetical protein